MTKKLDNPRTSNMKGIVENHRAKIALFISFADTGLVVVFPKLEDTKMSVKVVYIDDEVDLCEVFKEILESPEITISTFIDPEKAIIVIKENPPDLIFIDFRLPNITDDLIAMKMNNDIPKILVTGDLFPDVKYPFLKKIQKPYDWDELERIIKSYA